MYGVLERIFAGLPEYGYPCPTAPAQAGRHVEIDEDTAIVVEVGVDAIIGSHLRQSSRAAREEMI